LAEHEIHTRRYFFPSLDTLPYLKTQYCAHSRDLADRALCLPLYTGLDELSQDRIVGITAQFLKAREPQRVQGPRV
jgi:dTDP-4-amino-4,6-dideoxygalactose transaminase